MSLIVTGAVLALPSWTAAQAPLAAATTVDPGSPASGFSPTAYAESTHDFEEDMRELDATQKQLTELAGQKATSPAVKALAKQVREEFTGGRSSLRGQSNDQGVPIIGTAKLRREHQALVAGSTETVPLQMVSLAVPINPLAQLFCAGLNYRAHLTDICADEPKDPVIFKRTLDTLLAHGQPIVRPKASETLDYEGEITVVIGREGRHIAVDDAMSFVSGYSCFMEGSVRAYQKHSVTSGKNFWRTGSMGPWIMTADEIGPADLPLETFVNGEQRQS